MIGLCFGDESWTLVRLSDISVDGCPSQVPMLQNPPLATPSVRFSGIDPGAGFSARRAAHMMVAHAVQVVHELPEWDVSSNAWLAGRGHGKVIHWTALL